MNEAVALKVEDHKYSSQMRESLHVHVMLRGNSQHLEHTEWQGSVSGLSCQLGPES